MRTIIVTLESGLELVYELAWTPIADVVWDQLLHLSYVTDLSIDHQWWHNQKDSITGVCLRRTHLLEPVGISAEHWSYWCYQPRPGDICVDPLTLGRDLVSAWRNNNTSVIAEDRVLYPRDIGTNLLIYWQVSGRRANAGLRREIWRWLDQNQLADRIDWSQPQSQCHGRALVAYVRDHSQLDQVSRAEIRSIRIHT